MINQKRTGLCRLQFQKQLQLETVLSSVLPSLFVILENSNSGPEAEAVLPFYCLWQ